MHFLLRHLPICLWLVIAAGCGRTETNGGLVLVYKCDSADEEIPSDALTAIRRRVELFSPNCSVRTGEPGYIEILLPDGDQPDVEQIKKQLRSPGVLELLIMANQSDPDHKMMLEAAKSKEQRDSDVIYDEFEESGRTVRIPIGKWIRVARTTGLKRNSGPFRVDVQFDVIRDAETKEIISSDRPVFEDDADFEKWLRDKGIKQIDALVYTDEVAVTGAHIASARADFDQQGRPSISFVMRPEAADLMRELTGANIPDGDLTQRLGILLDDELMTAPTIQSTIASNGQITGKFTQQEVDFIVALLRAGQLPKELHPEPVKEVRYGD